VGFLAAILGRQQLYTENTLTVMLPLMMRRDLETLGQVFRLWSVVLASNLVGAFMFAWMLTHTDVFTADTLAVFTRLAFTSVAPGWSTMLVRGIFSGWLIAMMVWMMPAADNSRAIIIIIMTYLVALSGFPHVVAGSIDVLFLVTSGAYPWREFFGHFLAPTLIGNTIGGVSLVAFVNHAQVIAEEPSDD
jgi:formate/nitrite transporter FocA (FNT family)